VLPSKHSGPLLISPTAVERYPSVARRWMCTHCSIGAMSVWFWLVRSLICPKSVVVQSIPDRNGAHNPLSDLGEFHGVSALTADE
jgi:hypothetical protein